jgi:hypothetical protein
VRGVSLLEKRDDGWVLGLEGWRVERCSFDYQTRLLLLHPADSDASVQVVLESPFGLSIAGEEEVILDPNGPPEALGPVLRLRHAVVDEALVEKDGTLKLTFRGGHHLRSDPNLQYEAWHLYGPNGLHVVCVPTGGESPIWQEREEA